MNSDMVRLSHSTILVSLASALLLWPGLGARLFADDASTEDRHGVAFFERRIRPALIKHCYTCHSADAEELKGELRLDSRATLRRGGKSGPVIVARDVEASPLIAAIRYQDLKMPPDGKLPDDVIADFVKWVEIGAPDPRDRDELLAGKSSIDIEARRNYWAFQPLRAPTPAFLDGTASSSAIDAFVLEKLRQKKLDRNPLAEKHTLLRRLYFDLVGLPPQPREVLDFVGDDSPDVYVRVVDRLLASPHFGERWGRHWLDLAQYGDSLDIERIFPNHGAWRYRDYVIRALNHDKPFDRFVTEQIAGDLLPYESDAQHAEQIVATQFITQGPINLVNQFKEQLRMDVVDNQVDKVGRVFLGMTLGCSRCHDHKFDPIAQTDYYALAGILQNVQVLNGFRGLSTVFSDWLERPIPETREERAQREETTRRHEKQVAALKAELALAKEKKEDPAALEAQLKNLTKANDPRPPSILAATEPSQPTNARINIRGNALQLGIEVPRGVPRVFSPKQPMIPASSSGRLQLAEWLTRDNPIVPRVLVNRVWHHLFGTGVVRTVDNFGKLGEQPSHPELLDYLALRFIDGGLRIKALIREIVVCRTYRLSNDLDPRCHEVDPDNRLLWRHTSRRLDGEALRDSVLTISGELTPVAGGPTLPPVVWLSGSVAEFEQIDEINLIRQDVVRRRSIYLPVTRTNRKFKELEPLLPFDYPSPNVVTGARQSSSVPTQSLFLLNSPFIEENAGKLAERLFDIDSEADRVNRAYLAAYGRPATPDEVQDGLEFVKTFAAESITHCEIEAFSQFCHAILASTEFLTHD